MTSDPQSPEHDKQGQHVAFVRGATSPGKVAETLVAFANAGGGTLLIGLEPRSGEPTGLEDPEEAADGVLKAALAIDPALIIPMPQSIEKEGQSVIRHGPYKLVRHPGYLGISIMMLCIALALGSLWALVPVGFVWLLLVVRTLLEDNTLKRELPGYADYAQKIRFRLFPGLW